MHPSDPNAQPSWNGEPAPQGQPSGQQPPPPPGQQPWTPGPGGSGAEPTYTVPTQDWNQQQGYQQPGYQQPGYQQPGYQQPGYQQPGYQQPGYQQGYAQQGQPGYPGYQPGPSAPGGSGGKSRKGLWFAVLGVVVVAGLVVGGIALFSGGGGSSSASPGSTVTSYLTALSKGDSAAALATGVAPPSKILLTDSVLRQQQQLAKIANIKVVREQSQGDRAAVEATYDFGDQHADETYTLTKRSGKWSLDNTTVALQGSSLDNVPKPQLFGVSIANESKVYVFPGPLKFSSADADFAITQRTVGDEDKFNLSPTSYGYLSLQTALSTEGKQKAQQALQAAMKTCATSTSQSPDNCPNRAYSIDTDKYGYPDGDSASWTAPTDYSGVQYQVGYDTPTTLQVSGKVSFGITVNTTRFTGGKEIKRRVTTTAPASVYGTIDLSATPPVYSND